MHDAQQSEEDGVHDADDAERHPKESHGQPMLGLFDRMVDPMFETFHRLLEVVWQRDPARHDG